jgi:16S rRNA (cytosine1402-N4)-methyltransferase
METENPWAQAHRPVMVAEALVALAPRPGGVYCDATLGAGGHAEQILLASAPSGRLFGIDRDAATLAKTAARLAPFGDRFIPIHGPFGEIAALLGRCGVHRLDGLLADLGVSSMQLDQAARGFSFQRSGPIDMRMDVSTGETALELIERIDEQRLADILREYGEERFARRIARALKQAAAAAELTDTLALAATVERAAPSRELHKHPATRTFQALRIAVNDELRQLHALLLAAPMLLAPAGRLAVISFHSLEDRLVKQHLQRAGSWQPLQRRPIAPSDTETATNPRARSAHLRAASPSPTAALRPSELVVPPC